MLKYSLEDLFKNPPLFDVPPLNFTNEEPGSKKCLFYNV